MGLRDLALLPRVADGWTFLYVEHARIEQDQHAIVLVDASGRVPVPVAALSVLMLGPGTAVTHAAMLALADNGASVVWVGEAGARLYASGHGETRRAGNLLAQARAWADREEHLRVVRRMYGLRFDDALDPSLTLAQIRGKEGVRVREAYARAARDAHVEWHGRSYDASSWGAADPVNRALSSANACLYGLCHAAIVATGFSPGLGFVHTGKLLAFVYDVADFYKCETTIPASFLAVRENDGPGVEARVRRECRELFRTGKLLERIVPDVQRVLGLKEETVALYEHQGVARLDAGALWDPSGDVEAGANHAPSWEELDAIAADARRRHSDVRDVGAAAIGRAEDDGEDGDDA